MKTFILLALLLFVLPAQAAVWPFDSKPAKAAQPTKNFCLIGELHGHPGLTPLYCGMSAKMCAEWKVKYDKKHKKKAVCSK